MPARADSQNLHEIDVKLFGQSCKLRGPQNEAFLRSIHAVSPDQIYPLNREAPSAEEISVALEKTRPNKRPPSELDPYLQPLSKRLTAMKDFFSSFTQAVSQKQAAPLKNLLPHVRAGKFSAQWDALVQQTPWNKPSAAQGMRSRFFDAFERMIEPDPEEQFHTVIQKLRVKYVCDFDETEGAPAEREKK